MSKKPAPSPDAADDSFEQAIAAQATQAPAPAPAPAAIRELSAPEAFFAAIRESKPNQTALAKQAKSDPALARHVDSKGFNALTLALLVKKPELAKVLIEVGSELNCSSQGMGWNPLVVACAAAPGEDQIARLLLEKGANPSSKTHDGLYALTSACTYGNLALAHLLLDKGALAHPPDAGWLPIVAAAGASEALLSLIIERGGDPKGTLSAANGYGPLHHAARSGNLAGARMLIDKGAKIDSPSADGETPLHFAAQREDPAMAKLLLSAGADARLENGRRMTPAEIAATPELGKALEKAAGGKRVASPLAGKKAKAAGILAAAKKATKKTPAKKIPAKKTAKAMGALAAKAAKEIAAPAAARKSASATASAAKTGNPPPPATKPAPKSATPAKKAAGKPKPAPAKKAPAKTVKKGPGSR